MANRFPLTIDGSTIKELASGDNLDLTGSGISISSNQGNANQVLISTGSGVAWADASGGSSTFGVSTMTGDGSDTTLTLSADPGSENNTQVYIDGVYQPKSSYSVSEPPSRSAQRLLPALRLRQLWEPPLRLLVFPLTLV